MASTQIMSSKSNTSKTPLAFTILPNKDEEVRDYIPEPPSSDEKISIWAKSRAIKVTRLAWIIPQENPLPRILLKYINLFLDSPVFDGSMDPFMDLLIGPSWLRNRFLDVSPSSATMSNLVWAAFLTPTLLSTRIEVGAPGYGFVGYQPILVAK
ncbi:hypothetical protein KIW84_033900 [Lathyrus oleraceus]|uniref:Uncharacterized protein n=1 Tax=Pisum sativum TaxID=3888 RepID=A0A9D5B3Q5_PEA|nr:hypothetical protein KIW84_033900 [Pisum sativum]